MKETYWKLSSLQWILFCFFKAHIMFCFFFSSLCCFYFSLFSLSPMILIALCLLALFHFTSAIYTTVDWTVGIRYFSSVWQNLLRAFFNGYVQSIVNQNPGSTNATTKTINCSYFWMPLDWKLFVWKWIDERHDIKIF